MTRKMPRYKLVLLGHFSVGKSSLIIRFVQGRFYQDTDSTIGVSFLTQEIVLDKLTMKFDIWDTAGQERYNSLVPMYYRGAEAAIVVFDITLRASFHKAATWITELRTQTGNSKMVIALVGNKIDKVDERTVSNEDATKLAEDNGIFYFETSAKENTNVTELFREIARRLPKKENRKRYPNDERKKSSLNDEQRRNKHGNLIDYDESNKAKLFKCPC